jgi:hypothetical protein
MEPRDAFISYVEKDATFAQALGRELRSLGHSTWSYEEDGIAGVSYLSQVHAAIAACRVFVLVASKRSIRAHQVIREVEQAHEREKVIIPVRVGITHGEFASASPILRMASGTAVSLTADLDDAPKIAKRIEATIRFAAESARSVDAQRCDVPLDSQWRREQPETGERERHTVRSTPATVTARRAESDAVAESTLAQSPHLFAEVSDADLERTVPLADSKNVSQSERPTEDDQIAVLSMEGDRTTNASDQPTTPVSHGDVLTNAEPALPNVDGLRYKGFKQFLPVWLLAVIALTIILGFLRTLP